MTKEIETEQIIGIVKRTRRTPKAMKIEKMAGGKITGIFGGWNGNYKYTLRSGIDGIAINYVLPGLEEYLFPESEFPDGKR